MRSTQRGSVEISSALDLKEGGREGGRDAREVREGGREGGKGRTLSNLMALYISAI